MRTCQVIVQAPTVEFSGEQLVSGTLRACAGGVDDHAAVDPNSETHNDAQYRAHSRQVDLAVKFGGQPMPNARFTLRFDGNKGHDYGDGREKKVARLHKKGEPFDAAHPWEETLEMQADGAGKVSVWVLSSDVISTPRLQAILKLAPAPKEPVKLGEIQCDFAEAVHLRRFDNPYDPDEEEDRGWIFDFPHLVDPENKEKLTPAKLYLKFKKFPGKGDDYTYVDSSGVTQGNWQFVNGHTLKIFVAQIDLLRQSGEDTTPEEREITGTPEELRRYAFLNLERAASPDSVAQRDSAGQGETTPQVYVKAGDDIKKVKTIWVDAQDLTTWKEELPNFAF